MSLYNSLIFVKDNADFKLVEMMIVFVYDTARCRREEDDPAEAVVYFHPAWVSPTQRLALAGQLMGVTQFISTSFSPPRIIALQGGKFVLKKLGQYVLAVGTDRNIQDWVLERRADTLESTLKFFHRDLETISASLGGDRNRLTEKLYQMFETYLPILQYGANLFSNLPTIKFPKSASNVFLEAIQVLQYCQETNGILGGALFYNNKVVATQLNAELTKQIIITDPYRIKAPAETLGTGLDLPVGVQLLRVYIQRKQLTELKQNSSAERIRNSHVDSASKKVTLKKNLSKNNIKDSCVSGMKRDTSRIFTVPEEGELDSSQYSNGAPFCPPLPATTYSSPAKRKQEITTTDRPKAVNPQTPSVCSTPLKDVNRMLHGTAVSICSAAEDLDYKGANENQVMDAGDPNDIPDLVKEALRCKRVNKLKNAPPKEKFEKSRALDRRSMSLPDLTDSSSKHTNRVSLRYYSIGLPKLNQNLQFDYENSPQKKLPPGKQFFHTITDPCYPVFRCDGLPVSKALYDDYLATHYQELKSGFIDKTSNESGDFFKNFPQIENGKATVIQGFDCQVVPMSESPITFDSDVPTDKKSKQEMYRRSMSLPLKSLNAPEEEDREKSNSEGGSIFDLPQKRKLEGLQLTPLMSKLSLLADERTSGFCSRETTPSEYRDLSSFSTAANQLIKNKLDAVSNDDESDEEDDLDQDWISPKKEDSSLEKVELFLCGQQNMVLVLLMEENIGNNKDLVHSLWQTCVEVLGRLESRLQRCLEPLPPSESRELYSVLSVDPEWDTVHRAGLWGVTEIEIVSSLHDRFSRASNLTDIIVRTEDTVVYGYQCGKVEIFYQQAMAPNMTGGLPTPADLMGVVPLKAKRRLERDHGIVLL